MKILFAGPSLYPLSPLPDGIRLHPPAAQGNLQAAVLAGASVIGLVDGLYESIAAVWHKEILFALSQGVAVLGAASLGALRAAECEAFGMVAVGAVARLYADGGLDDDAAVAQLHAPADLGFQPVTEALVDCGPAIGSLERAGLVGREEAARLLAAATRLFFKNRTWSAVFREAGLSDEAATAARAHLKDRHASVKRRDALLLVAAMDALPDRRGEARPAWQVSPTEAWLRTLEAARARPVTVA